MKELFLLSAKGNPLTAFESRALELVSGHLLNWLNAGDSIASLMAIPKQPQGVVISIGKRYFHLGVHLIKSIRQVHNSSLPIQVYYGGPTDLDPEQITFLNGLPGVQTADLMPIFNNTVLQIAGWDMKPFALLAAPFEQVILLDADSVLLYPPEHFFAYEEYGRSGAIFFRDRVFQTRMGMDKWLETVIPTPLRKSVTSTRLYQGTTGHEQESGVIVVDRRRRFWGLLAACRLNCPKERAVIRDMTYGEKESFWFGFEVAQESYEWLEDMAGTVDIMDKPSQGQTVKSCGHLAHFNRAGNLTWFNEGIVRNKRIGQWDAVHFDHAISRGNWLPSTCIMSSTVQTIPEEQQEILRRMEGLWDQDPLAPHKSGGKLRDKQSGRQG